MEELFNTDMEKEFEKAFEFVMGQRWEDVVTADDDLYALEFAIMPMLANINFWEDSCSRHAMLLESNGIRQICMGNGGFEIKQDFQDPDYEIRDGLEVYVYTFPTPEKAPYAYYGAMICSDTEMRYYTLELAEDGGLYFCSPSSENHENIHHYDEISKEEFVQAVIDHFKADVKKK